MSIKPIKRVNVGEQVFQQLKQLLIDGEWAPGDKIPSENDLADKFGVSRITVRQALQKLNALGLLETRLGEGSFVKELDVGESMNALIPTMYLEEDTALQVFEFLEIIETECARLAAVRATEEDINDLKDILERMIRCKESLDLKGFGRADLDFHFKVSQITKNVMIIKTISILRDVLEHSMEEVIDKMGCENGVFYHKKILKAIEDHDEKLARETMREHIQKNKMYFKHNEE